MGRRWFTGRSRSSSSLDPQFPSFVMEQTEVNHQPNNLTGRVSVVDGIAKFNGNYSSILLGRLDHQHVRHIWIEDMSDLKLWYFRWRSRSSRPLAGSKLLRCRGYVIRHVGEAKRSHPTENIQRDLSLGIDAPSEHTPILRGCE
jgi:hypothetical protein